jgi:hypothetical protein
LEKNLISGTKFPVVIADGFCADQYFNAIFLQKSGKFKVLVHVHELRNLLFHLRNYNLHSRVKRTIIITGEIVVGYCSAKVRSGSKVFQKSASAYTFQNIP